MNVRNPERITEVMSLITQIWTKYPDMRFNQLIDHLQWDYVNKSGRGKVEYFKKLKFNTMEIYEPTVLTDLFYTEDDVFTEYLRNKVSEINGNKRSREDT